MGKLGRVPNCSSNYGESKAHNPNLKAKNDRKNAGRNKIKSFGFPSKDTSPDERLRWIKSISRLIGPRKGLAIFLHKSTVIVRVVPMVVAQLVGK